LQFKIKSSYITLALMKKIIALIFFIVLAVALYIIYFNNVDEGSKAPGFEAQLIDGSNFKLEDQKGKYTVLSFWGSWCPPCLKEAPELVALNKRYENTKFKNNTQFEIVSIAIEKSDKRTPALIKKYNLYWPKHIIKVSSFVLKDPLSLKYGVTDLPAKFLIDPNGIMIGKMTIAEIDAHLEKEKL